MSCGAPMIMLDFCRFELLVGESAGALLTADDSVQQVESRSLEEVDRRG